MAKDGDKGIIWKSKDFIGHQSPLNKNHKECIGSAYNLTVMWENEETTNEHLSIIVANNLVSCTIYAQENSLLDLAEWKGFQKMAQ